jgi:hypothetical protein
MVHFPIALLTLYAFLEVLSIFKVFYQKHGLEIGKGIILFAGTIGAMLSRQTGEMISEGANKAYLSKNVLELHEGFAFWATAVFVILSLSYLIYFFENIETFKTHKLYTDFKAILERSLKVADIVIADSNNTKKDLLDFFDIPDSKIEVVHLGIHQRFLENKPQKTISRATA